MLRRRDANRSLQCAGKVSKKVFVAILGLFCVDHIANNIGRFGYKNSKTLSNTDSQLNNWFQQKNVIIIVAECSQSPVLKFNDK